MLISKVLNVLLKNQIITFVDKQGTKHGVGDIPMKKYSIVSKSGVVIWLKNIRKLD